MLKMLKAECFAFVGVMASIWMIVGSALAQGVPTDWSNRHFLYQHGIEDSKSEQADAMTDPRRYAERLRRRELRRDALLLRHKHARQVGHVDWNVSLGGGRLADGAFPAKYSYNPAVAESCSSDWVVYGTNIAGTATTPNVVAYKNLYPLPTCTGTVPNLKFAYYVAGPIMTSPVISTDGTKMAFVESGASAIFHVASTTGTGSLTAPLAPPGNTSLALGSTDTLSSPFVDYLNDVAYVGTDDGYLHKITGVFRGTPTLAPSPWPIQLSPLLYQNFEAYGAYARLTSPVVYNPAGSTLGVVLVAGNYLTATNPPAGYETLFAVNADNPTAAPAMAITVGAASVSDGPLLDIGNSVAYIFSGNSNATYGTTSPAAVEQVGLNLSGKTFTFVGGTSALMGGKPTPSVTIGLATGNPIHGGTFDNGWFTSANGAGYLIACGTSTASAAPAAYSFPVKGGTLTTTAAGSTPLSTSATDICSPLTESYDGATDRFFVGTPTIGTKCTGNTGCIQEFTLSTKGVPQTPVNGDPESGGTSGIVVDPGPGALTYIYFSTLTGTGNPAIQLSQQSLQ